MWLISTYALETAGEKKNHSQPEPVLLASPSSLFDQLKLTFGVKKKIITCFLTDNINFILKPVISTQALSGLEPGQDKDRIFN